MLPGECLLVVVVEVLNVIQQLKVLNVIQQHKEVLNVIQQLKDDDEAEHGKIDHPAGPKKPD